MILRFSCNNDGLLKDLNVDYKIYIHYTIYYAYCIPIALIGTYVFWLHNQAHQIFNQYNIRVYFLNFNWNSTTIKFNCIVHKFKCLFWCNNILAIIKVKHTVQRYKMKLIHEMIFFKLQFLWFMSIGLNPICFINISIAKKCKTVRYWSNNIMFFYDITQQLHNVLHFK